jgi:hypothetical protein
MIRSLNEWLSGFVIIESRKVGSERRLTLEFWLPEWLIVYFRIRLLDKNEDEIASDTKNQEFDIERKLETSAAGKLPIGKRFERARKIYRGGQFRRVGIPVTFSESAYKEAVYFVLDIAEVSPEETVTTSGKPWYQQPNCIRLQTDRRNLQKNDSGDGTMFLLLTQKQAQVRTVEIIETFPRLRWQDRFAVEAQLELWRRMFKGKDSPLLTSQVAPSHVFTKIVCAAIKFAKKRVFCKRKRKTDRFDEGAFLEDIAAREYDPNDPGPGYVDPHELEIAQKHVQEVTGDEVLAEIVTGQIQGKKIAVMAKKHGLDVRNTQVRVSRSRTQLALPPRRVNQPSG